MEIKKNFLGNRAKDKSLPYIEEAYFTLPPGRRRWVSKFFTHIHSKVNEIKSFNVSDKNFYYDAFLDYYMKKVKLQREKYDNYEKKLLTHIECYVTGYLRRNLLD